MAGDGTATTSAATVGARSDDTTEDDDETGAAIDTGDDPGCAGSRCGLHPPQLPR